MLNHFQLYVDGQKVGESVLPIKRPSKNPKTGAENSWDVKKPSNIQANIIDSGLEASHEPPHISIGCRPEGSSKYKDYARPNTAFDELSIWTRKLVVNRTHNEVEYFLGGYGELWISIRYNIKA